MNTVIERMRARLADAHTDHGTPCRYCGTVAVACQVTFLETLQQQHCCTACRHSGAAISHNVYIGGSNVAS